jgi:hypothetical protein
MNGQTTNAQSASGKKSTNPIGKEIPDNFIGRGEVRGNFFWCVKSSDLGYIYEVCAPEGGRWYEVFTRRINTRFGSVSYPNSNAFGVWAWTYRTLDKAEEKFRSL